MSTRPLNVSYLVVGLIFLGISGSWALHASGAVDTGDVQWLMPLVLVGAGVIGLIAFTAKGLSRGRGSRDEEQPAADLYRDEPYAERDSYSEPDGTWTEAEDTEHTRITETENTDQTMRIEGEER
jgi:hypothetical protein